MRDINLSWIIQQNTRALYTSQRPTLLNLYLAFLKYLLVKFKTHKELSNTHRVTFNSCANSTILLPFKTKSLHLLS